MKGRTRWPGNWWLCLMFLVTLMISACSSATSAIRDLQPASEEPVPLIISAAHLLAMLLPIPFFAGIIAFGLTIPSLSAAGVYPFGGRKRRDLTTAASINSINSSDFDFDRYLTSEQCRSLVSLAALVEHALESYIFASKREDPPRRPATSIYSSWPKTGRRRHSNRFDVTQRNTTQLPIGNGMLYIKECWVYRRVLYFMPVLFDSRHSERPTSTLEFTMNSWRCVSAWIFDVLLIFVLCNMYKPKPTSAPGDDLS